MSLLISGDLRLAQTYTLPDDADAVAYIAAVEAADGQALETATRMAINSFVKGCKNDGIWPAIKASCILSGARTLAGALVPLAGTAPTNFNFVDGDYNRKTGLVGDGSTKYLDSNRNNNADPQNSKHVSAYATTVSSVGNACYVGMPAATGSTHLAPTVGNVAVLGGRINSASGVGTSAANTAGLVAFNRSTSTGFVARGGGSTTAEVANTSATPASGNILVFDGLAEGKSVARLAFYSIGESLDLALLDTRVTTLINAFAAAIP
jgi:hypothetical protein